MVELAVAVSSDVYMGVMGKGMYLLQRRSLQIALLCGIGFLD